MKYCSNCGSNKLDFEKKEDRYRCGECDFKMYLNSKPSACGVVIHDNRVLLVTSDSKCKYWDFPGGFLLHGEAPIDGLKRELYEEIQVEIEVVKLIDAKVGIYSSTEYSLNLFYRVNLLSDKIIASNEIIDAKWFDLNSLPAIRFDSTLNVLKQLML